jgi:hyaluronoglucosaminidase
VSRLVLGVIEGFYGRPWSWPQRESMLEFAARHRFNFYLYAPKNDPLHRNRWREPYLAEEMRRFEALARLCERRGVELCVGVSPLAYRFDDARDLEALWSKLRAFHGAGVRSFGLLFDDMPTPDVGEQVALVNTIWELLRALGADRLTLTPSEYCGDGSSPYLETLGAGLDPEIDVFWTGPQVCSPRLTAEHTRRIAATLRRKPLLWDNYPVNDLEQRFEAHIRPLSGREPEILTEARGLAAAAGPLAEAPKIALATVAEFARDPGRYDAEAAWSRALVDVTGDSDDAGALAVFGDLARRSSLELGEELDNGFRRVVDGFWLRWEAGDRSGAVVAMEAELARLELTAARMRTLKNSALRRELKPWAVKLDGWVAVGRAALEGSAARTLQTLTRARSNFHWVMGDLMDQFARRCLWEAQSPPSAVAGGG